MKHILPFLIILFFSCSKENRFDCLKKSGEINTETRQLNTFNHIEINEVFNVEVQKDTVEFIEIQTGENLIPSLSTDIENKTLKLQNFNRCNWSRNLESEIFIKIHYIQLDTITLNSYCKFLSLGTIKGESLIVNINANVNDFSADINLKRIECRLNNGTGDIKIKGNTDFLYIYSHGSGFFRTENLLSKIVQINNQSTGDCLVNVTDTLNVEYTGSGDIYYSGNPIKVNNSNQGEGSLIKNN